MNPRFSHFPWMIALALSLGLGLGVMPTPLQAAQAQKEEGRSNAVEVSPRAGLPNVLAKLKKGEEVTVAYLGGSITAAPGWRVKSLEWLQGQYPKAKLREIHAAIGGTGSDLGVFRVQQDALRHKPDLLFVEFSVNDGGAPPEQIQKCMEGIVRQTWKANPNTDICFVYTLSHTFLKDLQEGKFSRSATAMEAVADHYEIPSIHFGLEIAAWEKSGKLIFQKKEAKNGTLQETPVVFSSDGVHPFVETGHALYLEAIKRSWPKLDTNTPAPHALKKPLHAENWENAKIVPITKSMLSGDWTKLHPDTDKIAAQFHKFLPELWKAHQPGAELRFKVKGSVVSIYDLVGPDGGFLEVSINNGSPRKVARIDAYCTYTRLTSLSLVKSKESAIHEVRVKLLSEAPDKAKILFPRNVPDLQKNPAKYADNHWYAGSLLILGDLEP